MDVRLRLYGRIEQRTPEECWPWKGPVHKGYGQIKLSNGKSGGLQYPTHRLAYELDHGPIPKGYDVDHLCDNPPCCNPKHLEAVTHSENMKRMWVKRKARLGPVCGMGLGIKRVRRWAKRPVTGISP